MWLNSFSWSKSSRANAAHFNSSTHSCTSAFTRLAILEAWLSRDSSNSCNPSLLAAMQNSKFLSLGTHHPLEVLSSKKNHKITQTFALSTPLLVTLSTRPTGVGAPNPMGVERKPFTVKLDALNEELVEQIRLAHLPFEVSRSSIVNSLVTVARTQIQVTPASVQITPRNLSVADLSADRVSGLSDRSVSTLAPSATSDSNVAQAREGSVCQELPISTGAEPCRADVNSDDRRAGAASVGGSQPLNRHFDSAEMPTAPIPLPKKLRRAERAS